MIQRIQTLFLLAVAILHITLFFIPFWSAVNPIGTQIYLDAAGLDGENMESVKSLLLGNGSATLKVTIINVIFIFGALIAIFLFNNRLFQIKITRFLILVSAILLGVMFVTIEDVKARLMDLSFEWNYAVGIVFPIISIILLFLAARRIRHDENLVRSADRLR